MSKNSLNYFVDGSGLAACDVTEVTEEKLVFSAGTAIVADGGCGPYVVRAPVRSETGRPSLTFVALDWRGKGHAPPCALLGPTGCVKKIVDAWLESLLHFFHDVDGKPGFTANMTCFLHGSCHACARSAGSAGTDTLHDVSQNRRLWALVLEEAARRLTGTGKAGAAPFPNIKLGTFLFTWCAGDGWWRQIQAWEIAAAQALAAAAKGKGGAWSRVGYVKGGRAISTNSENSHLSKISYREWTNTNQEVFGTGRNEVEWVTAAGGKVTSTGTSELPSAGGTSGPAIISVDDL